MDEMVAIAHPQYYRPTKRDALLFDQFALLSLGKDLDDKVYAELQWLAEKEVVFEVRPFLSERDYPIEVVGYAENALALVTLSVLLGIVQEDPSAYRRFDSHKKILAGLERTSAAWRNVDPNRVAANCDRILRSLLGGVSPDIAALAHSAHEAAVHESSRFTAQLLRLGSGVDAVSIVPYLPASFMMSDGAPASPVLKIALSSLPLPGEDTPWERILEFREDEDARLALRRLRRWMRKVASENQAELELRDEFEDLLDKYKEYMRVHNLKTQKSTVHSVFVAVAEIIDNAVRLQLSKIVDVLFKAEFDRIELLQAELSAPGREVAYVSKAFNAFRGEGA